MKAYIYDSLNHLTEMEDENGYRQSFSYDAAGNMISYTDANQNKWTYEYDALSRITGVIEQKGGHIALSYGSRGELLKHTDQEGEPRPTSMIQYNHVVLLYEG
ncbi:MAG: hypothetical protein ACERKN_12990 [Velocimicrobium sp.]